MTPPLHLTVTLGALMEHGDWGDVVHLAGPAPAARLVASAEMVRDVRAIPPKGAVLLTVLFSADRDDWHMDALLSRAHARGTAAVLVEGTAGLRRSTAALAERLGLPILGAPDPLRSHRVAESLISGAEAVHASLVLRASTAARAAPAGIDGVVRALSRELSRPVAVLGLRGGVLSGRLDIAASDLADATADQRAEDPHSRTIAVGERHLVLCPVHSAGTSAWLAALVPDVSTGELRALGAALQVGAPVIEQRLAVQSLQLERDRRQRTAALAGVLQPPVNDATRRRALGLGWALEGWHTGVHIGLGVDGDFAAQRDDIVTALSDSGVEAVVVENGDGFAAWSTATHPPTARQTATLATRLRTAQHRLRESLRTSMGVGRTHSGPEGLGRTLMEAADAARLARSRAQSGYFLHVDRLGLAQLLLAWTHTDTFQPAASALLEPLRGQAGSLVETLRAFLDCESSITDTAALLGVHRNTVTGRIARIRGLLGVDLGDAEERLALHLAVRADLLKLRDTAR